MFGLEALDVMIGLVAVYLAFGMACTAIVEAITAWFNVRSSNLEAALKEYFAGEVSQGESFVKAFYDHPLVQALSKGAKGRPSYIPREIVGQVVESLIMARNVGKSLVEAVDSFPDAPEINRVKGILSTFVTRAAGDVAAFRKDVEKHFDDAMDRASGWFKRYTQVVALVASAVLVIGANVDTVEISKSLASSPEVRTKTMEIAAEMLKDAKAKEERIKTTLGQDKDAVKEAVERTKESLEVYNRAMSGMESSGLQLGWKKPSRDRDFWWYLTKAVGLLVSIFAVSLGAPFWFDILQRFMQVRASGASPRKTET
jgi:hypothetical protein